MSTLICGDLHGRLEIAETLLADPLNEVVFVGDLLDSRKEPIGKQIALLELILDACAQRENVTCLMGNHERSYLDEHMICSGFKPATFIGVHPLSSKIRSTFKLFTRVGEFLVTHAGVSSAWLPEGLTSVEQVVQYLCSAPDERLDAVGRARGGREVCGGPYWCDYWEEFQPIPFIKQVFGHSASRPTGERPGIVTKDGMNYNVDCLDWVNEVLEIEENIAKPVRVY